MECPFEVTSEPKYVDLGLPGMDPLYDATKKKKKKKKKRPDTKKPITTNVTGHEATDVLDQVTHIVRHIPDPYNSFVMKMNRWYEVHGYLTTGQLNGLKKIYDHAVIE